MKTTTRPDESGPRCPLTGLPVDPKTGRILNPDPKSRATYSDSGKGINFGKAVVEGLRRGLAEKEARRAGNPDVADVAPSDGEPNL